MNTIKKRPRVDTFTKLMVFIVVLHGLIMVTCSYVLAWFGKDTVDQISITLITEIVAPVTLQIVSNLISNIFEKNKLKFSTPLSQLEKENVIQGQIIDPKG